MVAAAAGAAGLSPVVVLVLVPPMVVVLVDGSGVEGSLEVEAGGGGGEAGGAGGLVGLSSGPYCEAKTWGGWGGARWGQDAEGGQFNWQVSRVEPGGLP